MQAVRIWEATACLSDREGEKEGDMSITGMTKSSSFVEFFAARRDSRYAVDRASCFVIESDLGGLSTTAAAMMSLKSAREGVCEKTVGVEITEVEVSTASARSVAIAVFGGSA